MSQSQTHTEVAMTAAGLSGRWLCLCMSVSFSDRISGGPGWTSIYYVAEMTLNFSSSCSRPSAGMAGRGQCFQLRPLHTVRRHTSNRSKASIC